MVAAKVVYAREMGLRPRGEYDEGERLSRRIEGNIVKTQVRLHHRVKFQPIVIAGHQLPPSDH